ncbi:ARM repeat protein interacting with ABF2 [Vitis vinifera]|uniref:ARM repeat protein interacting with ABF2 n=1 Tax=Vitis vinifera TaxID=29760 RepID=A0A438FDJ1_VITVI|nr:ARM repeat protein interacting with ABF2 [Vitis vinifera]
MPQVIPIPSFPFHSYLSPSFSSSIALYSRLHSRKTLCSARNRIVWIQDSMPNSDCKLFYPSLYLLEFLRINIDENIGRPMLPSIPNENAYLNRVVKPIYDLCVEVEGSIMGTTISIEKNNGLLQGEERKHERSESLSLLQDRGLASGFLGVCSPESADLRRPTGTLFFAMSNVGEVGIKRPCECTIAHDISLENVSRMHELSEAFHAISLRHTCLLSILEQFSKLSSRAGYVMSLSLSLSLSQSIYICHFY